MPPMTTSAGGGFVKRRRHRRSRLTHYSRLFVGPMNKGYRWLVVGTLLAGVALCALSCSIIINFVWIRDDEKPSWGPLSFQKGRGGRSNGRASPSQPQRSLQKAQPARRVPADWKRGPVAIFYNVYIPTSNVQFEVNAAIDIIKEQIAQIVDSPVSRQPLTLYYTLIGNARALNATAMQRLCSIPSGGKLTCTLLREYKTGSEALTLQSMLDFCFAHPGHRVTYLHTKGSFHVSDKNTNWRRLLTAAALSADCIHPPNATCNMCGLQFFTQFTFFVPGNMYTASCDYVQKLLPFTNDSYVQAREKAVRDMLLLRLRNQLKSSLLRDQRDFMGLDRYSDEHWVGSHPDIVPCDMDPNGNLSNVFKGLLKESDLEWAMGPRNSGVCGGISDNKQAMVRSHTHLRRREIYLLPGLLVKWFSLYGRAPDASSWVWSFFPDGDYWLQSVQRYGSKAVHVLTDTYRVSIDGSSIETAFASAMRNDSAVAIWPGKSDQERSHRRLGDVEPNRPFNVRPGTSGYAVFYHIGVPNKADGTLKLGQEHAQVQAMKELVRMQLEIVSAAVVTSSSHSPVTVFFTVAGQEQSATKNGSGNIQSFVLETCAATPNIVCQPLRLLDRNYEGETLLEMHQFCRQHPNDRVSYIHNQAPLQLRALGGNDHLIRHLTMAATSTECLNPIVNATACNVCGLAFHTLWTFFFPGNMFAASCEYVNRLLPPDEFEVKMRGIVGDVLLRRLRSQLTTSLFPERMDFFGLDRYAIDHWIGSHPALKPCDLSDSWHDLQFWRQAAHSSASFNWSSTFRKRGIPFDLYRSNEVLVQRNASFQRREVAYLAGQSLKWFSLYGEIPSPIAWPWWNIPEGLTWLKGIHEYGLSAIDKLTLQYSDDGL